MSLLAVEVLIEEVWMWLDLVSLCRTAGSCRAFRSRYKSIPSRDRLWLRQWQTSSIGTHQDANPKECCLKLTTFNLQGTWLVEGRYSQNDEPYSYYMVLPQTPTRFLNPLPASSGRVPDQRCCECRSSRPLSLATL